MRQCMVLLAILALQGMAFANVTDLVINEIMADPEGDWNGDLAIDQDDEWIEIYNPSPNTVNLGGVFLADDDADFTTQHLLPPLDLAPGQFFVVYRNIIGVNGGFFGALGNSGDTVRLLLLNGTIIDEVTYSDSDAEDNVSWVRLPDGAGSVGTSGPCEVLQTGQPGCPSPFFANSGIPGATPTPAPTATPTLGTPTPVPNEIFELRINEIVADPASDWDGSGLFNAFDDEWIELHNPTLATLSLNGLVLTDDDQDLSAGYRFGPADSIAPGGFVVVFGSSVDLSGNDFGTLNNGGDTVGLFTANGAAIDSVAYTDEVAEDGISWVRLPDGSDTTGFSGPCEVILAGDPGCPSPGESNSGTILPTPTPTVVITPTPAPSCVQSYTVALRDGWNLIGFGALPVGVSTASALVADIEVGGADVLLLNAWSANGEWLVHIADLPYNDFCLQQSGGLFVYVDGGGSYTFDADHCAPAIACP